MTAPLDAFRRPGTPLDRRDTTDLKAVASELTAGTSLPDISSEVAVP